MLLVRIVLNSVFKLLQFLSSIQLCHALHSVICTVLCVFVLCSGGVGRGHGNERNLNVLLLKSIMHILSPYNESIFVALDD